MSAKDFWALLISDVVVVILLIEYLCGLSLAIWCMCICFIVSLVMHIDILSMYLRRPVFTKKDYTR